MGGAHGHATHGHASDGHGGDGHADHAAPGSHAHGGEIPPAPAARSITPAPEDFQGLPGGGSLLWPVVWIAVGALAIALLLCGGWHVVNDDHAHDAPGESGAAH